MLNNLNIRVQNFKSYLDSGWVNLDGKNVLVGVDTRGYSNGSGKSSILDSLSLFLDRSWETYKKADITSLTNINAKKGETIIISIRCDIDGELFEASITGGDMFMFSGDEHLLAKFQQEMSGAIMTQGLMNNLADFERRSQLDEYIDQFYKVKDIIAKLKDFQKETSLQLGKKIGELKDKVDAVETALAEATRVHFTAKGQITLYQQYSEEDLASLQEEMTTLNNYMLKIYEDFPSVKYNLDNEKIGVVSRLNEMSNTELTQQRYNNAVKDRDDFVSKEYNNFINSSDRAIKDAISSFISSNLYSLQSKHNANLEGIKKERLEQVRELERKIQELSTKGTDYILTEEEIKNVNASVKDWTPQDFKLGDTFGMIKDSLNRFVMNVKDTIEQEPKEVEDLRKEIQDIPTTYPDKPEELKRAEELSISSFAISIEEAGENKPQWYIYWTYNKETNNFEYNANLPEGLKAEDIFSKLGSFSCNTSYYDNIVETFKQKLNLDNSEELARLKDRVESIDNQLKALAEKELDYQRRYMRYTEVKTKSEGYKLFLKLQQDLMVSGNEISNLEEQKKVINEEKEIYVKRQEDVNKLIDNISLYSGGELRNEFGFKLAKLSSILLNDIFNLEGEILLDSNGQRTVFKYNDGNGFLSFKVLSGGQMQKIKLSINLALLLFFHKDRQYLFLDEVFQHLDNPSKGLLINYIVKELGIKNILLIQHDSLQFEGFKEIRVYRDEDKNTKVV